MEAAIGALRSASVIFVVVAVLFGTYVHRLAKITASAAALAAAATAAESLGDTGWDCTGAGPHWDAAEEAAARAVATRTAATSSASAIDYTLAADPSCTVVASVTVAAAGARRWLEATAVACRPTRAAAAAGWTLAPPC